MEKNLYEAAIEGSVTSLHEILKEDRLILDRIGASCFNASPLHVAASRGHVEVVREILRFNPELVDVLDSRQWSPLHLASAKGHIEIVQALISINVEMCTTRDIEGRNSLHVAVMNGKDEVVEVLVKANPHAVSVRLDLGESILHLCVKSNQETILKLLMENIRCQELINAKDGGGNTILHLAVADKQFEIVKYLLGNHNVEINATNANGLTAFDILLQSETDLSIKHTFGEVGAKTGKYLVQGEWLTKSREALMVVASLIATMAFQAGVNPPGGVWQDNLDPPGGVRQDNSDKQRAGEMVMVYNFPELFPHFIHANTIGFVASITIILLLISGLPLRKRGFVWFLLVIMWLTITSMAFTYTFSILMITPKHDHKALRSTIELTVSVV